MDKKGKFNILHIDSFREFGGAQTDIAVLLKFMKLNHSDKFNIYVIHNGNERLKIELDKSGIYNESIKMTNFMDIFAVFAIRRFLKKYDIDLINFHSSLDHFLGGVAAVSIFKKKIAKVLTRHVAYKIDFLKGFLIYKFLTDGFIAISDFIKKRLLKDMKIYPDKIETIYSPRIYKNNGGKENTPDYIAEKELIKKELGIKPEEKIVSLIGRLSKEKGHEVLINAAELIIKKRNDIKFVIIGEGETHDYIAGLIQNKGLKEYFSITGFKKDIKKYILASDIIAVPSGLEGMGSIIIESCALKKTVIASNVGGIPEIIKDGETGFLFENGDYTELANKITGIIDQKDLVERVGLNCYNEVVKKFGVGEITSETAKFYINLLKSKRERLKI